MNVPVVFSIFGPPASGKSTLCRGVSSILAGVTWLCIDSYRTGHSQDEPLAWSLFEEATLDALVESKAVLLESAGLSWQMDDFLDSRDLATIRKYSIGITGEREAIQHRLGQRQVTEKTTPETANIEFLFQDWCWPLLGRRPCDLSIDTTRLSEEEGAEVLKQFIIDHIST